MILPFLSEETEALRTEAKLPSSPLHALQTPKMMVYVTQGQIHKVHSACVPKSMQHGAHTHLERMG